jgi:hypothetical protein
VKIPQEFKNLRKFNHAPQVILALQMHESYGITNVM